METKEIRLKTEKMSPLDLETILSHSRISSGTFAKGNFGEGKYGVYDSWDASWVFAKSSILFSSKNFILRIFAKFETYDTRVTLIAYGKEVGANFQASQKNLEIIMKDIESKVTISDIREVHELFRKPKP